MPAQHDDGPCGADRGGSQENCRPSRPYPYRRAIIIQQAQPAEDNTPPSTDWEGCRREKLKQLHASNYGDTEQANRIDEWLWKNCRSYSNELRQLDQDEMQ